MERGFEGEGIPGGVAMSAPASLEKMQYWLAEMVRMPVREMEGRFRLPLFDPEHNREIRENISPGPFLSSEERMGLLRQQFWFRMFVLMQERYPGLLRLFGYADFNFSIVEPFILKYFPDHWSLVYFGEKLPQWIDEEYHEEDRIVVLEMARTDAASEWKLLVEPEKYDFVGFRRALLERPPEYWEEHPFPALEIKT